MSDPGKGRPEWHNVDVVTGEVSAFPDPTFEQTNPIDPGHDPYNRQPTKPADDTVKVRTSDDMRHLDEEIMPDRKPG
jgi:hypothetical protein